MGSIFGATPQALAATVSYSANTLPASISSQAMTYDGNYNPILTVDGDSQMNGALYTAGSIDTLGLSSRGGIYAKGDISSSSNISTTKNMTADTLNVKEGANISGGGPNNASIVADGNGIHLNAGSGWNDTYGLFGVNDGLRAFKGGITDDDLVNNVINNTTKLPGLVKVCATNSGKLVLCDYPNIAATAGSIYCSKVGTDACNSGQNTVLPYAYDTDGNAAHVDFKVTVDIYGGGGGGSSGGTDNAGAGGGSGAHSRSIFTAHSGNMFDYTVGASGQGCQGCGDGDDNTGDTGDSTKFWSNPTTGGYNGPLSPAVSLVANGGPSSTGGPLDSGAGGDGVFRASVATASGGNISNDNGLPGSTAGTNRLNGGNGGGASSGNCGAGGNGGNGTDGCFPGGGGGGGAAKDNWGGNGSQGYVVVTWTPQ